jgi:hypothetical protein
MLIRAEKPPSSTATGNHSYNNKGGKKRRYSKPEKKNVNATKGINEEDSSSSS